jgi:hypothetical protein
VLLICGPTFPEVWQTVGFSLYEASCPKPVESFSALILTGSLHKHIRSFINWRPFIIIVWFQKY